MVEIARYFTYAAALFFAGSWTFGVLTRPEFRLKSTVSAIVYWWLFILAAFLGWYSPFHLWWLMPATLIVMTGISGAMMRQFKPYSTSSLIGAAMIPLGLCAALAWFAS
jgi:hypothetical protein